MVGSGGAGRWMDSDVDFDRGGWDGEIRVWEGREVGSGLRACECVVVLSDVESICKEASGS